MAEITVLDVEDKKFNYNLLTPHEREDYFEKLLNLDNMDITTAIGFRHALEKKRAEAKFYERPEFKELLLRKIISIDAAYRANKHVIPIIGDGGIVISVDAPTIVYAGEDSADARIIPAGVEMNVRGLAVEKYCGETPGDRLVAPAAGFTPAELATVGVVQPAEVVAQCQVQIPDWSYGDLAAPARVIFSELREEVLGDLLRSLYDYVIHVYNHRVLPGVRGRVPAVTAVGAPEMPRPAAESPDETYAREITGVCLLYTSPSPRDH
jgi:hypothetical protein